MRVAVAITLNEEEQRVLGTWSRGRAVPARLVTRAKMILMAAEWRSNEQIAEALFDLRLRELPQTMGIRAFDRSHGYCSAAELMQHSISRGKAGSLRFSQKAPES